jgi:hypothetical protein
MSSLFMPFVPAFYVEGGAIILSEIEGVRVKVIL